MSLTTAKMVSRLNADLQTAESEPTFTAGGTNNLLIRRREALAWLSRQALWSCLHTSEEGSALAEGSAYISFPSNFRILDAIVLNDGSDDGEPLKKLDGGYPALLKKKEDLTSADYDEPEYYVQRLRRFYLWPVADGAYTPTTHYWRYHPDQSDILFGDDFEEALYCAFIAAYLDGKGRHAKARYYWTKAEAAVRDLKPDFADERHVTCRYRDL